MTPLLSASPSALSQGLGSLNHIPLIGTPPPVRAWACAVLQGSLVNVAWPPAWVRFLCNILSWTTFLQNSCQGFYPFISAIIGLTLHPPLDRKLHEIRVEPACEPP